MMEIEALSQKEAPSRGAAWGPLSCCLDLGLWARVPGDGAPLSPNPAPEHDSQRSIAHVLAITKNTNLERSFKWRLEPRLVLQLEQVPCLPK